MRLLSLSTVTWRRSRALNHANSIYAPTSKPPDPYVAVPVAKLQRQRDPNTSDALIAFDTYSKPRNANSGTRRSTPIDAPLHDSRGTRALQQPSQLQGYSPVDSTDKPSLQR